MAAFSPFARERAVAEAAVLRAALLTKKIQEKARGVAKGDKSPVTEADFAAQALMISALQDAFPKDSFVGEEDSTVLRANEQLLQEVYKHVASAPDVANPETGSKFAKPSDHEDMLSLIDRGGKGTGGPNGRFWGMDPVDGTKTFLLGHQYAISLALIENGQQVVGVLCCPNLKLRNGRVVEESVDKDGLGIMLSAVKGKGVSVRYLSRSPELPQATRLERLRGPAELKDLHIVDSRSSTALRHDVVEQLAEKFGASYPGTEVWSSHVRYATLILGGGDAQVRVPARPGLPVYIWDHAGTQLIFTEAGGKITDLDGKPMDFSAGRELSNNRGMIIAREAVHADILSGISQLLAKPS
ncbi:unnamed protein product [Clonostachys solani]|uniref:3'(2'),5'-bisphosphate nucleotidase n=1 Tax=Clonostachys solani TaxID=160281 RepID=A0A9N9Z5Q0_9HYPO|nr:unnamed protein product [Clonostachys solani]